MKDKTKGVLPKQECGINIGEQYLPKLRLQQTHIRLIQHVENRKATSVNLTSTSVLVKKYLNPLFTLMLSDLNHKNLGSLDKLGSREEKVRR